MPESLPEWLHRMLVPRDELTNRPRVTLSYAQTLDGSFTRERGAPTALSGDESMKATHLIRSSHQGILVGIGTVLSDDPKLTVRPPTGRHPRPVVLDSALRLPATSRLLEGDRRPLVLHSPSATASRRTQLIDAGAVLVEIPDAGDDHLDLSLSLEAVRKQGIMSLMVEGGPEVLVSLMNAGLWDCAAITLVPRWLGGYGFRHHRLSDIELQHPLWLPAGSDVLCLGERRI